MDVPAVATILVVDDEAIVRETCGRMLESLGFAALSATNGQEAVDAVRRTGAAVSAVVLDLLMPVMNGEEAFAAMRALRPDLPILITSGFSPPEVCARLCAHPGTAFLRKPYTLGDLERAVRGLLPA